MKNKQIIFTVLSLFLLSACSVEEAETVSSAPIYNSVNFTAPESTTAITEAENTSSAVSEIPKTDSPAINADASVTGGMIEENAFAPVTDIRRIERGNSFEENVNSGYFCPAENGFYFVDPSDRFLYFMDNERKRKTVLKDYVCKLNYYDGFLYYIKGTKSQFLEGYVSYAGSVWRFDPASGEEVCLIDVPKNMSLNVNEYGIFCNPSGGGLARYGFDGKEIERLSNENQGVCFIGNKLYLKKDGKIVLRDMDTGKESDFPDNMFFLACVGDFAVCSGGNDQSNYLVLNLFTGETGVLPQKTIYSYAVCGGELYVANSENIYRVNFDEMKYESVVSYPDNSPVYFFSLHSDGEHLYAAMMNQSNASILAEINTESGEVTYMEEE